ncbi:MAG TPA: hypothetical protein VGN00_25300 [Puia sp.]|jgi:putative phosphoribosyl transferase
MNSDEIHIVLNDIVLPARLYLPDQPKGLVIAVQGRNCKVLKVQNDHLLRALSSRNIAILFTYLLDPPENQEFDIPLDIGLMTERLEMVTKWSCRQRSLQNIPIGYFAANTAAAAAMEASISIGNRIRAIVSHCGRPDLASPELHLIKPATLLITGSENRYLTELNRQAYRLLSCETEMVTFVGDPGNFEATGAARRIAQLSADWFEYHLLVQSSKHASKTIEHAD